MLTRLRLWWRYERRPPRDKAEAIASIRETFAWFGYPLDDLADEGIEAGIAEGARQIAAVGITAQEAAEGMKTLLSVGGGEVRLP